MVYSISDAVKDVLGELTFLRAAIEYDLLNYSAVARFILPLVNKKMGKTAVSQEAVSIAVRRYVASSGSEPSPRLLQVVRNCKIILRTDLSSLIVRQWMDIDFIAELRDVLKTVDFRAGEKFYVIARSNDLFIICSSRFLPEIESKVRPPARIATKASNLSLLTINVQSTNFEIPGVVQFFVKQFELAGINLHDVFSTRGKITFLFHQRDAARAYERISSAVEATKAMPFSEKSF